MARIQILLLLIVAVAVSGCSCDPDSDGDDTEELAGQESRPDEYRDHRVHQNLLDTVHLADVHHHGLFIDLGTPAAAKYLVGGWNSGWGSDISEGDTTARLVGRRGRIYFHADRAESMVVRLRLRPHGTRALTPYLNNEQLQSLHFTSGDGFQEYDFPLPQDLVRRGENYLLLTFGGTTPIGDENVSVALASVRIASGTELPGGDFVAPTYDSLATAVEVDGEERRALVSRRPARLSWHIEVPANAALSFGLAYEGTGEADARVMVSPEEGEPAEIFRGRASAEWENHVIPLEGYAGQIIRVDLEAVNAGAGRLAWSSPAVLVAPPDEEVEPETAQNVIVLLVDTLRASKLRAYNPRSRVRTPVIDRMAEEGLVFERSQSPENWTKPSCASILTGLFPMTHGAKDSGPRQRALAGQWLSNG